MTIKFKRSIIATALVLPLAAGAIALASTTSGTAAPQPEQKRYAPVWHNQPTSVGQAVDLAAVVVRATVVDVRQAPDVVVPAKAEPGGVDRVATQAVTLRTKEVFKGSMPATFTVSRTGGPNIVVEGDPAYRTGQQYVLALQSQRPDGRWVLVSPEGRYQVRAGKVYAISDVPGVAKVNGRSYDQFRATVENAVS
ncbi:MAG: hypothetical protein GEU94_02630 [Micromonosporaceae bacterium]|nr:hypothetical protein [Micromonosporaceae bacterium]